MARPLPRRRAERDAPDADQYAGRGRDRDDDPGDEDRRPRRGRERGELPSRGRGREPDEERTTDGTLIPQTEVELEKVDDDEYEDLLKHFDVEEGLDEREEFAALWEAIEKSREPEEPRSRRGRGSEPDEEPPARGRGRGRGADPEDEPPARGRGRGRDEEPEDEPRGRGRGRGRGDDDDEPRGRGRGRGRGDDDEPRGRGRGRSSRDDDDDSPRRVARSGFAGYKQVRSETSSFADDFKLTDEEVLVKFLDDEPFATYGEHGLYQELKKGQRVWPCLAPEEECPICNTGHEARPVALWNIVVMPETGKPQVKVLKAGPKLEGIIEKKAALKTGPMSKEYYSLSQTEAKNKGPVEYAVEVIRERDLKSEWKEEPFTDAELDAFDTKKYDATFVKFPKMSEAKEVARELRDND